MHLLFKPDVTCRPTRNLWLVNYVFSTFRRQNSVVKISVGRVLPGGGAPSHGKTGTGAMVNLALPARRSGERCKRGLGKSRQQHNYLAPRKRVWSHPFWLFLCRLKCSSKAKKQCWVLSLDLS